MKTWGIPLKIPLRKRKYFKEEFEFEVIYKYLTTIRHKFAVVPKEMLTDVQSSVVKDRPSIQVLVAQNINVYESLSKEEQDMLLSYFIDD